MSNGVTIQVCKFAYYQLNGSPSHEHWGYRIYDDYGQDYDKMYETLEDVFDDLDTSMILGFIKTRHENFYESVLYSGGLLLCNTLDRRHGANG